MLATYEKAHVKLLLAEVTYDLTTSVEEDREQDLRRRTLRTLRYVNQFDAKTW